MGHYQGVYLFLIAYIEITIASMKF